MARINFQYKKYPENKLATAISFFGGICYSLIVYAAVLIGFFCAISLLAEEISIVTIILAVVVFVMGIVIGGIIAVVVQKILNTLSDAIGHKKG